MVKMKPVEETIMGVLGIELTEQSGERIVATMPVHAATHQPFGLLHGGASVVLAETVASFGTWHAIDQAREIAVGLEINANHIRAVRSGLVTGTARPLHIGRRTQVWEIRIEDEAQRLSCVARLTMAVVERAGQ